MLIFRVNFRCCCLSVPLHLLFFMISRILFRFFFFLPPTSKVKRHHSSRLSSCHKSQIVMSRSFYPPCCFPFRLLLPTSCFSPSSAGEKPWRRTQQCYGKKTPTTTRNDRVEFTTTLISKTDRESGAQKKLRERWRCGEWGERRLTETSSKRNKFLLAALENDCSRGREKKVSLSLSLSLWVRVDVYSKKELMFLSPLIVSRFLYTRTHTLEG